MNRIRSGLRSSGLAPSARWSETYGKPHKALTTAGNPADLPVHRPVGLSGGRGRTLVRQAAAATDRGVRARRCLHVSVCPARHDRQGLASLLRASGAGAATAGVARGNGASPQGVVQAETGPQLLERLRFSCVSRRLGQRHRTVRHSGPSPNPAAWPPAPIVIPPAGPHPARANGVQPTLLMAPTPSRRHKTPSRLFYQDNVAGALACHCIARLLPVD